MNESTVLGVTFILTGLLLIAISIPLVKGYIKMNSFYGMRIKKAFESDENWYKINKYGGKRLIFWSIVLICIGILNLIFNIDEASLLHEIFPFAPIIVLIPFVIEIYIFANKL